MFINVYRLIFRKLEIKIVDNSNSTNIINTSYPQRKKKDILLKYKELDSPIWSYHHIHSTY